MKALANPARIFYVPYNLALFNFIIQFMIFVSVFIIDLSINAEDANSNLMIFFIASVCLSHFILAFYSKREPQMMQIILAKINIMKRFIPKTLRV